MEVCEVWVKWWVSRLNKLGKYRKWKFVKCEYNDECPASSLRSLSSPVASWNTLPSPPPTPCGQHVTRHISTSSQRSTRQKHLTLFSDCPFIKYIFRKNVFLTHSVYNILNNRSFYTWSTTAKKTVLNILPKKKYRNGKHIIKKWSLLLTKKA